MRGQGRFAIELIAPTLLVSLLCVTLGACGGDTTPRTSGTAGKGGSGAAGNTTGAAGSNTGKGGSTGTAGSNTGAGGSAAGTGGSTGAAGSSTGTGGSTGAAGSTTGAGGSTAGTGGSTGVGGTSGTAGASGASGGAGSTGAGGAGSNKPAIGTLAQANGNGVVGTATFTPDAQGFITLVLQAKNCPGNGAHSFHLHVNADCSNDGLGSGMQWAPKGQMLGTIMCGGGTGGMAMYKTPSAGYWTIGTGDMASDILLRSIVIDMGTEAMPGNPIACSVPRQ
jgi:hypothetical protein